MAKYSRGKRRDGIPNMKASKLINKGERPALAAMLKRVRKTLSDEGMTHIKFSLAHVEGQTFFRIHGSVDDCFLVNAALYKHSRMKNTAK